MRDRRHPIAPTTCLEDHPSSKTIRLGGRHINLSRLAEYGFDHGYLSYILSGERQPSIKYATRIAKCLGILTQTKQPDVTGLLELIADRKRQTEDDRRRHTA